MSISRPIVTKMTLQGALEDLVDVLVEEEVCDIVNEGAHDCFYGKEEEEITEVTVDPKLEIVNSPNMDIFGQILGKKPNFEIQCPNCKRTLAAARFAPHLEKCMGMGRNSSRIASRRLAASAAGNNPINAYPLALDAQRSTSPGPGNGATSNTSQANNGDIASEDDHFEDVDDDEDWTMEKKRRGKRGATEKATHSRR